MRIDRIELQNFRAFPGPAVSMFSLHGKNLLLYGENGSGKSSLVRALSELFSLDTSAAPFADFENVFARAESPDGFVRVVYDDGLSSEWRASQRPNDARANDIGRRKAILDYRALLRTNYGGKGLEERLFDLAVSALLINVEVPTSSGVYSIGQLWQQAQDKNPQRRTTRNLREMGDAIDLFNNALQSVLARIEARVGTMLDSFAGHSLQVKFDFPGVTYDKTTRSLRNRQIFLEISYRGQKLGRWTDFLNEARLTALALTIYLSATIEQNPSPPPGAAAPLKLLVLDDVLIGLDMSNRLPVLELLNSDLFSDFQVILSTYDLVWFEMARQQTEQTEQWVYLELYDDTSPDNAYPVPVLRTSVDLLSVARKHLRNHDLRAAAVYARSSLENKLRKFCEEQSIAVPYVANNARIDTEKLLTAIERRLKSDGKYALAMAQLAHVKMFRKVVLNRLSHAPVTPLVESEVEGAIKALGAFQLDEVMKSSLLEKAKQLLGNRSVPPDKRLQAAWCLRTEFEMSVRRFCAEKQLTVTYRDDWSKLTVQDLWNPVGAALQNSSQYNGGSQFASEILNRRDLFLDNPNSAEFMALTASDLRGALDTLKGTAAPVDPPTVMQSKLDIWAKP